jgi:hypothetical protein
VIISPIIFQTWKDFSVPSNTNLPDMSNWKKAIPFTIRFCLIKSIVTFLDLSLLLFYLIIFPNENLPFSGLSSEILYNAKKTPFLARTTLFCKLFLIS